jgi:hypothetical protein
MTQQVTLPPELPDLQLCDREELELALPDPTENTPGVEGRSFSFQSAFPLRTHSAQIQTPKRPKMPRHHVSNLTTDAAYCSETAVSVSKAPRG